ncbi:MAG: hypothetical protein JNL38_40145 [Myxococcales bacterium]|nr:hypothetical protein [Myxococcales bacterium]
MGRTAGIFGVGLAALALSVGCAPGDDGAAAGDEDDLTSLTARGRELRFEGVVFVDPGASDAAIVRTVRKQTQTAFGALLAQEMAVQSREVKDVDPATFKKRSVRAIDPDRPGDRGRERLEVRYTYVDNAVVPVKAARKTSMPSALLGTGYDAPESTRRVVEACTKNDKEAREDAAGGLLWYDFDPSRAACKRAIDAEQKVIDGQKKRLADPKNEVAQAEVDRLFLPVTFALTAKKTNAGATYPEYHRLFSGGVADGRLVVSMIAGRLNHDHAPDAVADSGYYEWMDSLGVIFEAHPGFTLKSVEPAEDLSTVTVGGRRISGLSFADFVKWTVYDVGYPAGLSAAEKKELKTKVGQKLDRHWVTFEKPVSVSVGGAAPRDFVIQLDTYFGADEDPAPHKRATKKSDVVVYNGHSYIGYGPLDPSNFRASDFSGGYQLLFFDSCVSYNYYEEGFFALKDGGSKNLDMITNGLEAPEWQSGASQGAFVSKLIDGSMPSYKTLLGTAKATDSMRVVDGEVDNVHAPGRPTIKVLAR